MNIDHDMTERQMIFMWVMVGISLFLGLAVTSCLVTFAVLDTRASLELRVQVQELKTAMADLTGRLDNTNGDTGVSASNLTTAVEDLAARLDTTSKATEEQAIRANNTTRAVEDLSAKTDDNARAVSQVKTKNEELSIRVEKNNLTLSSDVARLQSGLEELRVVISNLSSLSLPHCRHYKTLGLPSGVYNIDLHDGLPAFPAFCDMDTEDGPWLVFQRRQDGSVNFTRNWADYTSGFGHLEKEFWLGLENLHQLTSAGMTNLRVDMATWEGKTGHALYSTFKVANSSDHYRLEVHGYSGNAGDDMYDGNKKISTANGMQFSTYDQDHDIYTSSCAEEFKAGWWYNSCHNAHPNGVYGSQGSEGGQYVKWWSFYGNTKKSLKFMEMKIK